MCVCACVSVYACVSVCVCECEHTCHVAGLAVLSKLPMGVIWVEHLSKSHGPDTNQRIALHVPIIVDSQTTVNVIAVHFSYHRQQQCQNAAEILKFIHRM